MHETSRYCCMSMLSVWFVLILMILKLQKGRDTGGQIFNYESLMALACVICHDIEFMKSAQNTVILLGFQGYQGSED